MRNLRPQGAIKQEVVVRNGPRSLKEAGLTFLHPFYNERERFELLWENWMSWSDEVRGAVQIILVDDCSPSPVHTWFTPSKMKRISELNIGVYRITDDLKWNTPGTLNLGFTVAPDPWVLTMDSDCTFDAGDMSKFLAADPVEDAVYKFNRQRYGEESEGLGNKRYLPCSMLMHKNLFWHVGGFDEDFTGEYSGGYALFDSYFDLRRDATGHPWYVWEDVEAVEWMPSIAAKGRPPEEKKHYKINKKIMYAKQSSEFSMEVFGKELSPRSPMLRFNWERTLWHKREE